MQCLTNGSHDVVFGWEAAEHGLLRDGLVVHPDGELSSFTFDETGVDVERGLECRGRTGRAGPVVSGPAEADGDGRHQDLPYSLQAPGSRLQAVHSEDRRLKTADYRVWLSRSRCQLPSLVQPPSTGIAVPLMNPLCRGSARNATALATSSGYAKRPIGMREVMSMSE